jgi:hypothetical protein
MSGVYQLAARILIFFLSLIVIFHLIVLLQFIPFESVWGGRLKTKQEMYLFESVSIFVNLVFLSIVLTRIKILILNIPFKLIRFCLFLMSALFLLNTLGNLNALSSTETLVFTPITFILFIACLVLALEKKQEVSRF